MDKIRNEYIRGTVQVGRFGEKGLRWFGHVLTTEERCWVYWENDSDDGAARKEETGKA